MTPPRLRLVGIDEASAPDRPRRPLPMVSCPLCGVPITWRSTPGDECGCEAGKGLTPEEIAELTGHGPDDEDPDYWLDREI